MASIILEVDAEIKAAFERANPDIQKQLSDLVQLFLREQLYSKSLTEVMAEISERAKQRGLTPEILQDILANDNDE